MKLEYFAETDTLCVDFADRPSVESREVEGVVIDYDAAGAVVGLSRVRICEPSLGLRVSLR
jgi:uncharacterized protein YuzE